MLKIAIVDRPEKIDGSRGCGWIGLDKRNQFLATKLWNELSEKETRK